MISLLQYAESIPRKEEFIEYLRCFTGYDEHAIKRSSEECNEIYTDFENKYSEKMEYDEFVDIYFWEFVRQEQTNQISEEECSKNEKLLRYAIRKRVETSHQTPMTFTEWKNFFNREKKIPSKDGKQIIQLLSLKMKFGQLRRPLVKMVQLPFQNKF